MQRKPLVMANWKLYGDFESISSWQQSFQTSDNVDAVLCPPFPFLSSVAKAERTFALGAQNVSQHLEGAFTGEVSARMLKSCLVDYVIVGHSERRALYGETDQIAFEKVQTVIAQDLRAVLCVGENQEEREAGTTFDIIEQQLERILTLSEQDISKLVVAYEPIWAIGTGLAATPDMANEVHHFIRNRLAKVTQDVAQSVQILYGGSVKPNNAAQLAKMPDIDGALVGGASLDAQSFTEICQAFGAS